MPRIHFDCPNCTQSLDAPEELASQLIECPSCNETIEIPTRSRPSKPAAAAPPATPRPPLLERSVRQDDEVFFHEAGIVVSRTRFVVRSQTFALANISSVRGVETPPSRTAPIVLLLLGLLAVFASVWFSLLLIAACIAWMWFQKSTFSVVLTAAGGEVTAYSSYEKLYIHRVLEALTQAIIARG
jgi:Family of unknown function (DUF6232)